MTASHSLTEREQRSIFPTYNRFPVQLVEGEGCRLRDADGRTYLDFVSGLAVNSLGCAECRPPYRDKLVNFLRKLPEDVLCKDCQRRACLRLRCAS